MVFNRIMSVFHEQHSNKELDELKVPGKIDKKKEHMIDLIEDR
jgi:hypothetical protein